MTDLVSPEYSFEAFCRQMLGKDWLQVIDSASAEIAHARTIHEQTTKDWDFRKGSRGGLYCDDLQRLISMLVNGSIPTDATPEFLSAAKPLVLRLLQKWDMEGLRRFFANTWQSEPVRVPDSVDTVVVVISRREVVAGDLSPALSVLGRLMESPQTAREYFERVDIAFHGYDHVAMELSEIPEVRDYVYRLDEQFPFWLFFLSKRHLGLHCILLCLLPPSLTEEGRSAIFPEHISRLLTNRWFPAMNHVCEYAGLSDRQNKELTDRVLRYITSGKLAPGS